MPPPWTFARSAGSGRSGTVVFAATGRAPYGSGHDAVVLVGMQFTEPAIADAVAGAREAGVDTLVGLPVYPLCGPSTNVAALADLRRAVDEAGWEVPVHEITGWHVHPEYTALPTWRGERGPST